MIRFEKDWQRFPKAIVDTKTRNKSFLRIASLFKEMGIRHYYFPLALLQPELQGLSPYDEDLTLEQKAMMLVECDNNPWYYLREVVIDRGAGRTIEECQFRANRGNIAAMWLMLSSIDYARIQPRQTGKSFETYAQTDWLMYFAYRDTALNLITKDESLRKDSVEKSKRIRDSWPEFLNRNTKTDDNNQITLSCKSLGNKYYTHVGQKSEKAANNLGRGMTSPLLHFDEPPFIDHIETTIAAAVGATGQAREIAKRKGVPFCNIYTTTAGDKESRDGQYMFNMISSAAVWDESFYDARDRDELVDLIRKNSHSRAPMVNITLSHNQLGFSDEWLYEIIAATHTESENIDRDFFNRWTASGQDSLIDEKTARIVRDSEMEPIDKSISNDNYILRWYQHLDPNRVYVAGLDTSDAIGRDDIALVVIDPTDGSNVASGLYNESNLMDFARWLCEFMVTYPNVLLIPERKHNAQTIIDYLLIKLPKRGHSPFERIYSEIVQNPKKFDNAHKHLSINSVHDPQRVYDLYRKYFGFQTTAETRKLLYKEVLSTALTRACDKIHDKNLIHQLLSLSVRNGRVDHRNGGHDDCVIAWLLGHWLINYGINLNHYGIPPQQVMSQAKKTVWDQDPYQIQEQRQQERIKEEIDRLYEQLVNETSQIVINRLENELRALSSKLKYEQDESVNIDTLIENAKEQRDRYQYQSQGAAKSSNRHISALLARYGQ